MAQSVTFLLPVHHHKCFTVPQNNTGGLRFTLCTSDCVLLKHVSREALAIVGAYCVDTSVVADVAHQALVHVLHLHRTIHCILPIPLLTDGEGLFRVRAVRYCSTQRERLLFLRAIKLYNDVKLHKTFQSLSLKERSFKI